MISDHGGNIYALARQLGCEPQAIIDMSSNINPLGPPPGMLDHLRARLPEICHLPEVDNQQAIHSMAAFLGIAPQRLLAGNGTTQFIHDACPALAASRPLIVAPTYADYADACRRHGLRPDVYMARAGDRFAIDPAELRARITDHDLVFICNPNNPTGSLMPREDLIEIIDRHPRTHFVVDESYLPFVAAPSLMDAGRPNLGVLWSLSKIFCLPGLRAGFLIAEESFLERFQRHQQPWAVNRLAQAAVVFLESRAASVRVFTSRTQDFVRRQRQAFQSLLAGPNGLTLFPGQTAYVLIQLPRKVCASDVCARMARQGILIRDCTNFDGLGARFVRIALKTPEINRRVAQLLLAAVAP